MEACGGSGQQNEKQKCAICLEDIFSRSTKQTAATKAGAVVPCGHLFHDLCFHRWQSAQRRRLASQASSSRTKDLICKCPMCNRPAETFVKLFLDDCVDHGTCISTTNSSDNGAAVVEEECFLHTVDSRRSSSSSSEQNNGETQHFNQGEETLLADRDRIKHKLKRYKRQNKTLKQEIEMERAEMEEMLVSTTQNFYRIIDKHEEERKRWNQGALDLRLELDVSLKQQSQERRDWSIQQKRLQQEMQMVQMDCARAEHQVQSATEGLAELKLHNGKRQSKLQVLLQEKSKLVHENRKLKKAVLTSHSSIRSERLW